MTDTNTYCHFNLQKTADICGSNTAPPWDISQWPEDTTWHCLLNTNLTIQN